MIQALELQSTQDLTLHFRIHVTWFPAGGAGWGGGSVKHREILGPIHNSDPTVIADEMTISTGPKWRKAAVFADWTLEFLQKIDQLRLISGKQFRLFHEAVYRELPVTL
jgi:hypothetical protein